MPRVKYFKVSLRVSLKQHHQSASAVGISSFSTCRFVWVIFNDFDGEIYDITINNLIY